MRAQLVASVPFERRVERHRAAQRLRLEPSAGHVLDREVPAQRADLDAGSVRLADDEVAAHRVGFERGFRPQVRDLHVSRRRLRRDHACRVLDDDVAAQRGEIEVPPDVAHAVAARERAGGDPRVLRRGHRVLDRNVVVAVAAAVLAARIRSPDLDARAALVHLDAHRRQRFLRLLVVAAARRLEDLDLRVAAAAARDDDVAGQIRQAQLAAIAETHRARRPVGLLGGILPPDLFGALALPLLHAPVDLPADDRHLRLAGAVGSLGGGARCERERGSGGGGGDNSFHL